MRAQNGDITQTSQLERIKMEIKGNYTSATLYLAENPKTNIDQYALSQLNMLCNNEALEGSRIRIMPDVHAGKVGTIGFTATVGDKIMPQLIGIDIGCGMTVAKITKGKAEWQRLDRVIRDSVPSGSHLRKNIHNMAVEFDYKNLECRKHIQDERADLSLGTLGGGNHFIEVDTDGNDLYLVVHSGSRNLGKQVTDHYMTEGQKYLKAKGYDIPYELTWLEGNLVNAYLHDVSATQDYAALNRHIIIFEILKGMKWKSEEPWDCRHNYIASDSATISTFGSPLLRKGAISAMKDEKVVIPINMKDGMILGTGKGNIDWNCSAPHGAGRILKREDVKKNFTVSAFKSEMKGIYTSCISTDTLDEAPFAYRRMDDIISVVGDTISIDKVLKPLYNFKAGNE